MKILLFFLILTSCSSAPENTEPVTDNNAQNSEKEGALDEVMKNKDCGLFDVFYDGCKTIYSDAEKSYYEKKGN